MRFCFLLFILFLVGCTLSRPINVDLSKSEIIDLVLVARDREINILAISGGGPNGVWSAGFLRGWKNKPNFDIVTGVSVGSIISSHAFINDSDNSEIEQLLINLKQSDFVDIRPLSLVVFNNSASSNDALKRLIKKVISDEIIDKVAYKARSGEKLYVGTTDLDHGRFRIWDMTELAIKKQYDNYRKVILASASIPIVYSPVFLENSMNVDGAVIKQVFIPFILPLECRKNIYVLHNGIAGPNAKQQVQNSLKDIGLRTAFLMTNLNENHSFEDIFETPNASIYYSEISNDVASINFFSFDTEQVKRVYYKAIESGQNQLWNKMLNNK